MLELSLWLKMSKEITGTVVSDKMNKTIVVEMSRVTQHPRYGKRLRRHKKFLAHDEKGQAKVGGIVVIRETRPLSKRKKWELVEIVG